LIPSYRIKRRYILIDKEISEEEIKNKYIYFFGFFDFLKANIRVIKREDNFTLISVNRKNINRLIFVLYLMRINVKSIFRTIKEFEKYFLNIDKVK